MDTINHIGIIVDGNGRWAEGEEKFVVRDIKLEQKL